MVAIPLQTLEELEISAEEFEALVQLGLELSVIRVMNSEDIEEALAQADQTALDLILVAWAAYVSEELLPHLDTSMVEAGAQTIAHLAEAVSNPLTLIADQPLDVEAYLQQAANRLVGIGNELWFNARTSLTEGIALGESQPKLAQRIRDAIGVTEPRARTIARTESHGARNVAAHMTMQRFESAYGVPPGVMRKEWQATEDERTRHTHDVADGQTVGFSEPFIVGGAPLMFPGDPTGPPGEIINCVTGDTVVDFASLRAVTRRWFEGDVIEVSFSTGNKLTVTPNHPILRADGAWVAAGDLVEGNQCVYDSGAHWFSGTPDKQVPPPTIGQIYRSASEFGDAERVSLSPPDFHGDGSHGDVDIVPVYGSLRFEGNPATDEQIAEFGLSLAREACARECGGDRRSFSVGIANGSEIRSGSPSFVGGASQGSTFGFGESRHPEPVSFATSSDGEVQRFEVADNCPPLGSEFGRHRQDAGSLLVHADDLVNVQLGASIAPGFTRVEHVRRVVFSGHVYNLDTGIGWYNANGITTRNCRCAPLAVFDPADLDLNDNGTVVTLNAAAYLEEDAVPWSIETGNAECSEGQHAVVKDADGTVEGCHDTRDEALAQVAALYASEGEKAAIPASNRNTVPWSGVLVVEGTRTGDGREFAPNSLTWPVVGQTESLELSLGWMYERAHGGMSTDKVATVGRIDTITRVGNELHGTGVINLDSEWGRKAARQMGTRDDPGFLAGVSIDADDPEDPFQADVEYVFPEGCSITEEEVTAEGDEALAEPAQAACEVPESVRYHTGRIRAATLVDIPAFVEGRIYLDAPVPEGTTEDDAEVVTASAYTITIPDLPPVEWFAEPEDEPEIGAITVTEDGRFYGYLAPRQVAHRGIRNKRVTVPTGNVDYGIWMNRATIVDDGRGGFTKIATGPITMDCGHAPLGPKGSARREHYDNACSVVATARVGENSRGVWISGALIPGVNADQVSRMMACQLSGDWGPHRERPGKRELAAALLVPVPGFPTAQRSFTIQGGELSKTMTPVRFGTFAGVTEPVGLRAAIDQVAAQVGRDHETRMREFVANLRETLKGD